MDAVRTRPNVKAHWILQVAAVLAAFAAIAVVAVVLVTHGAATKAPAVTTTQSAGQRAGGATLNHGFHSDSSSGYDTRSSGTVRSDSSAGAYHGSSGAIRRLIRDEGGA